MWSTKPGSAEKVKLKSDEERPRGLGLCVGRHKG